VLGAVGQSQQPAISAEEAEAGKTAEHDAPTTPAEEDEEEEAALGPADAEVAGAAPSEGQQGEQNLEEEEREEDAEVENWDKKAGQDADYDEEEEEEEEEEEADHVTEEDTGASLLFYGVRGQQMREGDAPSYFNPLEVTINCLLLFVRSFCYV
jgi:putative helicase MOV10L1